ncbi:hypothetical protein BCR34DRAFT_572518 [Clohesyomyces aquaticus]|uniref:Uncharacterized protein n=1 Tax=Clohesyomyces aquaticus TaxID=1231657 RepID=A0A1Y1Z304_9PLEO|nr:hypothetical protein BCR34DRAFT_572518 [Clohesyomyces aquaticus]
MASYVRLFHKPYAKVDPNTWLFLIGTNWAAIDFFRHISLVSREGPTAEIEKAAGTIGASLTILFWGNVYALLQLVVVIVMGHRRRDPLNQRVVTLLLSFILPSLAQSKAFWMGFQNDQLHMGRLAINRIPFLY